MNTETLTVERVMQAHQERRDEIRSRLSDFQAVWDEGTDARLWEEMVEPHDREASRVWRIVR